MWKQPETKEKNSSKECLANAQKTQEFLHGFFRSNTLTKIHNIAILAFRTPMQNRICIDYDSSPSYMV